MIIKSSITSRGIKLSEPSGNAIEFKSFNHDVRLFAVQDGAIHIAGGGVL